MRLLTILLVDTNDNIPEFEDDYTFNVPENRPKDYLVGKVVAEDKDEGRHAKVYYYIVAGEKQIEYLQHFKLCRYYLKFLLLFLKL